MQFLEVNYIAFCAFMIQPFLFILHRRAINLAGLAKIRYFFSVTDPFPLTPSFNPHTPVTPLPQP